MKKVFLFFLTGVFLLAGCGPNEEDVNRQINQTIQAQIKETVLAGPILTQTAQVNNPQTETSTPVLTFTSAVFPSAELTVTSSPSETSLPTPTAEVNQMVIRDDPVNFLLEKNDLPLDAHYFLPGPDWMSVNTNEEVIFNRGVEQGRDYVLSTGRETGWWVNYQIGVLDNRLPDEVFCFVGRYATPQGAQLALTDYSPPEYLQREGWVNMDYEFSLGDVSRAYSREQMTSGGDILVWNAIEFTYFNMLVQIQGYGYKGDVSFDFLVDLGEIVLGKILAAELEVMQ